MSGRARKVASALLVALVSAAGAATPGAGTGTTYRWVDEQGIVHYGDRIPPQYSQKEGAVLNSRGVEIRKLDAQKTAEQMAADDRVQQGVIRQKQHDAFLLSTYTSAKDIEALRDVRLDQLRGQRTAAEQYRDSLHARLMALQTRARLFKPYSDKADARRMPDDLAEDLVRSVNELQTQNDSLLARAQEETALKSQFQADIERYRELRAKQQSAQ